MEGRKEEEKGTREMERRDIKFGRMEWEEVTRREDG